MEVHSPPLCRCAWQEELAKIEERLGKWTLPEVHRLMDLVDLPRGSGEKVLAAICPDRLSRAEAACLASLKRHVVGGY